MAPAAAALWRARWRPLEPSHAPTLYLRYTFQHPLGCQHRQPSAPDGRSPRARAATRAACGGAATLLKEEHAHPRVAQMTNTLTALRHRARVRARAHPAEWPRPPAAALCTTCPVHPPQFVTTIRPLSRERLQRPRACEAPQSLDTCKRCSVCNSLLLPGASLFYQARGGLYQRPVVELKGDEAHTPRQVPAKREVRGYTGGSRRVRWGRGCEAWEVGVRRLVRHRRGQKSSTGQEPRGEEGPAQGPRRRQPCQQQSSAQTARRTAHAYT